MRLSLIVAYADNRVIGLRGGLPWKLPADLRHFKRTTTGHAIIMGRRTFDEIKRPLPERRNIVISRSNPDVHADVETVASLDDAIALARVGGETEAFIVGGGEIYRMALPLVDRMYITHVRAHIDGDTTFPKWDESRFTMTSQTHLSADEANAHAMDFAVYDRKAARD